MVRQKFFLPPAHRPMLVRRILVSCLCVKAACCGGFTLPAFVCVDPQRLHGLGGFIGMALGALEDEIVLTWRQLSASFQRGLRQRAPRVHCNSPPMASPGSDFGAIDRRV